MAVLKFTLTPEGCSRIHDVLSCFAKFHESVSIEAGAAQLTISCLNSSKSAYASTVLSSDNFFSSYNFIPDHQARRGQFACRILNKALLSVFKNRVFDLRGKDTAVERCEVTIRDEPDETECRFVIKLICRHGVTKTYKLTYEVVDAMHALFNKDTATSRWKIPARFLREFAEYFGAKTEQLDLFHEKEQLTFTSYTEKIATSKEILKQPLETSVTVAITDFEHFDVIENQHVAINVRDFKNLVVHAETLKSSVIAMYSEPNRPLQFSYDGEGMHCEFTLMTIGDFQAMRSTTNPASSRARTNEPSVQPTTSQRAPVSKIQARTSYLTMPPPRQTRPLGSRQTTQLRRSEPDAESLFISGDDDERIWEPAEEREEEDTIGWDASGDVNTSFHQTFQNSNGISSYNGQDDASNGADFGIAPTQRASQIRGLFDD